MVANHNELLPIIAIHFLPLFFFKKKPKIAKNNKNPKNMLLTYSRHFQQLFQRILKKIEKEKNAVNF
jgi:hypothetical protein